MDWNTVSQIALAFVASVGGAGIIIIAVSKWLATIISKQILQKNEHKLSRSLENYKSDLDKRNYVSKVRFDLEIETYRQLSEAFTKMVFDNYYLYPPVLTYFPANVGKEYNLEYQKQIFEKSTMSYELAKEALARNAPFISKEKYSEFREIMKLCASQIFNFSYYELIEDDDENAKKRKKNKPDRKIQLEKTIEIGNKLSVLIEEIRKQINNLEVF